jgi:hypothetical protein
MRGIAPVLAALAPAAFAALAFAGARYAEGPLPSHTGAPALGASPAETNCTLCHTPANGRTNLDTPGGGVEILDLPAMYAPGVTYRMRVRLSSDSTAGAPARRWGFQLTAVSAADGTGAGTFGVRGSGLGQPGDTLQIVDGDPIEPWPTRRYVEHVFDGVQQGASGPVEWSLDWTAPAEGTGTVRFFVAGNAANGSGEPGGDFIYTSSASMTDTTTAARRTSWGALKARGQ